MRIESLLAILVREPFRLSLGEARKLTFHQIAAIYFHETDPRTGAIEPRWSGRPQDNSSDEEIFKAVWRSRGLSKDLVEHKWREFLAEEGLRDKLERAGQAQDVIEDKIREFRRGRALYRW